MPDAANLIGRNDELRFLRDRLGELSHGRGGVVWLSGEPGIGKSSLVATALADASAAGMRVFRAVGDELTPPIGLRFLTDGLLSSDGDDRQEIADLLGGRAPGLDATLAATERMIALVERECGRSPVIFVADDLQWADDESLAAMHGLLRVADQSQLLIIAVVRPGPERDALGRLHAATLRRPMAGSIDLAPLDEATVARIAEVRLGAVPGPALLEVLSATGGNPLYLVELLNALLLEAAIDVQGGVAEVAPGAAPYPASLSAAIGRRMGYVSAPVRETLRMAAVLDSRFTIAELVSMSDHPVPTVARHVDEALRAGMLIELDRDLGFRHPLIRQLLYEEVPLAVRVGLHEHAARVLAAAEVSWDRVARHLLAAPEAIDGWAIGWLVGVPRSALLARPAVAADLLGRARTVLASDDPRRALVTARLGAILRILRRADDLVALGPQVLEGMTDPASAGEFAWHLTRGYQMLPARSDEAIALIEDFLARVDPGAPWRSRLMAQRAVLVANSGRVDDARRCIAEAVDAGERDGDPISVGYALNAKLQTADVQQALEIVERALSLTWSDDPESMDLRVLVMANRLIALLNLARWSEFEKALVATVAEAERVGSLRIIEVQLTAVNYYYTFGEWDQALLYASQIDARTAYQALAVRGVAALIHARRGETELALEQISAVAEIPYRAALSDLIAARPLMQAKAHLAEAEGDLAAAISEMSVWIDPTVVASAHARAVRGVCVIMLVRLAMAAGDRGLARAAADAAVADAAQSPDDTQEYKARLCRGMVEGDPDLLMSAIEALESRGSALELAMAMEELAIVLAGRGDLTGARAAFAKATDGYETCGAVVDLRRLQARARPYGIRRGPRAVHRRATLGWEALTETERSVARLVAEGHSNPEIASRLYVSRRTVETHVTHVLHKLQLRSRVDIRLAAASPNASLLTS